MVAITIDDHGRPEPPLLAGEVATLLGFLDFQRATLAWKCRGLDDRQLNLALPPTSMTLAGLLKHLAYVEDSWLTETIAGDASTEPWASADWEADRDWEWHSAAHESGEHLRELWDAAVRRSRAVVEAQLAGDVEQGLSRAHPAWEGQGEVSLRWVLVHLVEEYARHVGHADLIRESIDGETGE